MSCVVSCVVCVVRQKTNRSKWPHVEVFAKQDGYTVLFDLISQSLHWRYPEIAQFSLEIIYMTCLVTHPPPPPCVRACARDSNMDTCGCSCRSCKR